MNTAGFPLVITLESRFIFLLPIYFRTPSSLYKMQNFFLHLSNSNCCPFISYPNSGYILWAGVISRKRLTPNAANIREKTSVFMTIPLCGGRYELCNSIAVGIDRGSLTRSYATTFGFVSGLSPTDRGFNLPGFDLFPLPLPSTEMIPGHRLQVRKR